MLRLVTFLDVILENHGFFIGERAANHSTIRVGPLPVNVLPLKWMVFEITQNCFSFLATYLLNPIIIILGI